MSHLERRRQLWYALLTIPADLREHFGKIRFIQSTGTADKREAEIVAGPLIASWRGQIREARGQFNPLQQEAMKWKKELAKATDPDQQLIIHDLLEERTKAIELHSGPAIGDNFHGLSTGTRTPTNVLIEDWKAQVDLAQKTKDQMFKDVDLLVAKFGSLEEITKGNVKRWMDDIAKTGKGPATQKRIISFCRNYWNYLQSHEAVPADADPFFKVLNITKTKKGSKGGSWVPFSAEDVVTLWTKAVEIKKDTQLQDLIKLGAYTGARIEELCSLKVTEITKNAFKITDSKTAAGIREVPIHSALLPLVERLKNASEDGYLISGLTENKYGDRSNAIGKRFGRLKKDAGYSEAHVFHSIRKTLTTLLENAGVSENLAADIVGHEKPRITYGLYSGGATLEVRREALEKVKYPFSTSTVSVTQ